jgi:ABC-type sugar transport system ATPase subunit
VIKGRVEIRTGDKKFVELPKKFVKHFGYVPENRREEGLFLSSSVATNISIGRIQNISNKFGFISQKKERKLAEDASKELGIKMVDMQQLVETLSGGNQQKVIIARWLMFRPDIFILDDPTKGLDIGAKADVHNLINKLVEEGISIIMISSDIDEILHMSDRIIILANKRIIRVIDKKEANKELLMKYSIGIK